MDEKCLKQYQTYPECCLTSNFPNLGLKCHFPRLPSSVWGGGGAVAGCYFPREYLNIICRKFSKS